MILPIALAKGTPLERFQTGDYTADIKTSATAALNLYYEIEKLKTELIENVEDKRAAAHNKRIRTIIKSIDGDLSRIIKHSDYTAMTTVAFENNKIIPLEWDSNTKIVYFPIYSGMKQNEENLNKNNSNEIHEKMD